MTFFDKKTEMINFELTPYGKSLLARGELKPKYYDFSDEDILYDVAFAGNPTENTHDAHNRIVNETPKLKNILIRTGIESNFNIDESGIQRNDRMTNTRLTYDQKYLNVLGKSSEESDLSPQIQVTMLKGNITSSANILTSSAVINLPIPQISIDVVATLSTSSINISDPNDYKYTSNVLSDGKFAIVEVEEPLIHLKEFGSIYEKENFDIEVFSFEPDQLKIGTSIDKLVPLLFTKQPSYIEDGIYREPEKLEQPLGSDMLETQPYKLVEYHFLIETEEEFLQDDLCEAVEKMDINNQFLDNDLMCKDQRTERFDLYGSIADPEDCD